MTVLWPLLATFLVVATSAEPVPPGSALSRAVDQLSAQLLEGVPDPDPEPTKYVVSTEQTAVLFIMHDPSGGNATVEVIAFFTSERPHEHRRLAQRNYRLLAYRQIGSRGLRQFDANSGEVHNGRVVLEGATYLRGDPMCCRSQKFWSSFAVEGGHVVEQTVGP